jgi:predicted N-acetyltransferase YhbS
VATADRFRKRGLATAVVLTAIDAAHAAGADFVFLIADAEDWPKEMYAKLGFEAIGITYEFQLPPDDS